MLYEAVLMKSKDFKCNWTTTNALKNANERELEVTIYILQYNT